MFDFLSNNANGIIAMLISILASTIPIPMIVKNIIEKLNEANKTKIELKDAEKKLMELSINEDDLEAILNSIIYGKEDVQQDTDTSTPPSPKPPKYDFTLRSSKTATLKELYEKRNTDKSLKKISFTLAVIMSIIGTIILFTGILISLFTKKEIGWITTSSGAIIEVVASIYFWLVNRTMKEVKDNSKQLEKTEDLFTAIDLVEKISDISVKDEVYKNIIDNLMNQGKNK